MSPAPHRDFVPFARQAVALVVLAVSLLASSSAHAENRPFRFRRLSTEHGLSDSTVEAIVQDGRGFMWFGTADGLNRYDGYDFKVYRSVEGEQGGISGSYIWDLLVDSRDVLWVATGDGLSRYDARTDSFVGYRHDPAVETTLTNDGVLEIAEDSRGDLWVGTGGGLDRFDRATGRSTRYVHDEADPSSLSFNYVETILEDRSGRLWVGTQGGLDLYDRQTDGFVHFRHDPMDPTSLSNDFVRVVYQDRRGDLWVGTEFGLNRMDPERPGLFERFHHDSEDPRSLPDDLVWSIHEDREGTLWIGTDRGGLAVFDRQRGGFDHSRHDASDPATLASDAVYALYEDDAGDLWTGNFAGGVNYLDRRAMVFDHYRHDAREPTSLSHNSVLAVAEDSRGELWAGTENGLSRFDRAARAFVNFRHDPKDPRSLSAPAVLSIAEDRDGELWVGTWEGGLHRFDRARGRFSRRFPPHGTDPGAGERHIQAIEVDAEGRLWLGTFNGAYRMDPDGAVVAAHPPDWSNSEAIGHEIVWTIRRDSRERIWFGTHDGLSLYEPERDGFVTYRRESAGTPNLNLNQITAIHPEGDRLWFGTLGAGLGSFDLASRTFAQGYLEDDGLASNVVNSIVGDASGDLWIGTNRGLSRFDPETETFLSLDERDGIQGRQFNRAALRTSGGELVFGGIHGLNVFDPAAIRPNEAIPRVVLTSFEVFNRPLPIAADGPLPVDVTEAETITLDPDDSVFTFEFAALSFQAPGKNEYAYRLVGFDDDWVYSGNRRSATYTNLNPGNYTFRVKASNNSGVWNEDGASVEVVVLPPYWATWWFRALSALAVLVVATLGYRARVRGLTAHARRLQDEIDERVQAQQAREKLIGELEANRVQLERQNAELERFAYTVSHDLKGPLVTIQGFLGVLEKDMLRDDRDRARDDIRQIEMAAEKMRRLLDEVLDLARIGRVASPTEEVSLTELAHEAAENLSGAIAKRGATVDIACDLPVVLGDRTRLLEVFQNLIENALKFSRDQPAPRIEIGVRRDVGEAVCLVRDNGAGIEPAYHDKVFGLFETLEAGSEGSGIGLALVKRIVEVHGGRVWIESEGQGRGSTFCFVLPEAS